jgi:hypothetical protein
MEELNNLFFQFNYLEKQHKDIIKSKLLKIVYCYLYGSEINFETFDKTSKDFIKNYGEEIIIKEIKKHSDYVNINDVKDIIYYCLE